MRMMEARVCDRVRERVRVREEAAVMRVQIESGRGMREFERGDGEFSKGERDGVSPLLLSILKKSLSKLTKRKKAKRRYKRIYKYLINSFRKKKNKYLLRICSTLIIGLRFGLDSNRYSDRIFFGFDLK